jgi:predicted nucleic-acid-binding Zn-ribbon protein
MPNQVQCPNCGGYKVTAKEVPIDGKKPVPIWERVVNAIIGLAFVGAGFMFSDLAWLFWLLGTYALLYSLFISTRSKTVGKYYAFYCKLCGYQWKWQEGQPWPEVKVNPDLIAKGAQKLEEEAREAEEERKRQEALYHLSKLGKK